MEKGDNVFFSNILAKENVVNTLRKEYSSWINSLSEKERIAIKKYSYNSFDGKKNPFYERLNAMLRGKYNKKDKDVLERYADTISHALKKQPLQHNLICYRGVDFDTTIGFRIGTIFRYSQFISTSVVRSRCFKGTYTLIIRVPKGTSGAYIEQMSKYPKQREFLIDKDCQYKLIRRKNNKVWLEVIK